MKNKNLYSHLLFRRQFLFSPVKCLVPEHWKLELVKDYYLHAHPDLDVNIFYDQGSCCFALIGFMIDPYRPDRQNQDILKDLAGETAGIPQRIAEYLHPIGGRFVLIIRTPEDTYVFHDPCGLRMVHYAKYNSYIYLATQPYLFRFAFPVKPGDNYKAYYNSEYVKAKKEHYLPSGCSLFENIYHLVPNHYFCFSSFKQVRYFPNVKLNIRPLQTIVEESSDLLKKIMVAANRRFEIAFALSSGWDSRLLLAASKDVAHNFYFYTFKRRNLTLDSPDIKIPGKLLRSVGFKHNVLDINKKMERSFEEVYKKNTPLNHLNDWGNFIHGSMDKYPGNKVTIQGGCDIYKCTYHKFGWHRSVNGAHQLLELKAASLERGWRELPFLFNRFESWFHDANDICNLTGFDVLDLIHWEILDGSWLPQGQTENDLVMEIFTPLNNRKLLEIMLSSSSKYRSEPERILLRTLIRSLWPEIYKFPIKPASALNEQITLHIMKYLGYLGLLKVAVRVKEKIIKR